MLVAKIIHNNIIIAKGKFITKAFVIPSKCFFWVITCCNSVFLPQAKLRTVYWYTIMKQYLPLCRVLAAGIFLCVRAYAAPRTTAAEAIYPFEKDAQGDSISCCNNNCGKSASGDSLLADIMHGPLTSWVPLLPFSNLYAFHMCICIAMLDMYILCSYTVLVILPFICRVQGRCCERY